VREESAHQTYKVSEDHIAMLLCSNRRPNRWTGSHNFGNASAGGSNQAGNSQGNSRTASPANNVAARGPSTSTPAAPAGLTALSNEDNVKLHDRMLVRPCSCGLPVHAFCSE